MRSYCMAALLTAIPWTTGAAQSPLGPALKEHGWFTSYEAARAEAKRTGKPLMVVFRCEP